LSLGYVLKRMESDAFVSFSFFLLLQGVFCREKEATPAVPSHIFRWKLYM